MLHSGLDDWRRLVIVVGTCSGWSADLARRGRRHAGGRGGAADPVHPTPTPAVVWIYTAVVRPDRGRRQGPASHRVRDLHTRRSRLGRLRRLPRPGLDPLVLCAPRRQEAYEPAAFGRGEEDATGAFTDVPLATMVWERSHSPYGDPVPGPAGRLGGCAALLQSGGSAGESPLGRPDVCALMPVGCPPCRITAEEIPT